MSITSEQYGTLLIPIIMTKLPQNLCLHIVYETDQEIWQINDCNKEVVAKEATEFVKLYQRILWALKVLSHQRLLLPHL